MRTILSVTLLSLALAACGAGGGGQAADDSAANNAACALIADAEATFGEGAAITGYDGPAPIAASCEFASADGVRSGEVVLFTQETLGAVTPADQIATLLQSWDDATETALQPVPELGAEAQLATDLPGYQTQIAFVKGQTVIAAMGSSGDNAMSGERIARALAMAAAAD
jgi:hypothetical protein